VKVRHNNTYTTQYLHMTRRAVKRGQQVRQGQVIGYVGSTGLATGPHVCYRFWKNGKQVDPYRQKFPAATPIPDNALQAFNAFKLEQQQQLQGIAMDKQ
jgi:murein DD-endopeptidase MepM/ murein hydrolase activator NlpD